MTADDSVSVWIQKLKEGDARAAQELWQRYYERLVRLARSKLKSLPRRAFDEEDVALSAFQSFYGGVQKGRFPQLHDRDDLWQILVVLAGWKVADRRKHEGARKRGEGQVRGESALLQANNSEEGEAGLAQVVGDEPTPEFAVMVAEECERLLDQLGDARLREVALLKLEGYTNEEIAERLGCVSRTVDRKLRRIRAIWSRERPS